MALFRVERDFDDWDGDSIVYWVIGPNDDLFVNFDTEAEALDYISDGSAESDYFGGT